MPGDSSVDAVVVGAGPNGLAAAVALARAGLGVRVYEAAESAGGGCRTAELTLPGFRHDVCSAIHPLGVGAPFLRSLPLEEHGLEWVHPEVPLAHPLDGGAGGALARDLDEAAAALGADGPTHRRLVEPLVRQWDALAGELLRPVTHLPRHPLLMARFGLRAVRSLEALARRFETDAARALWAGMAAHAIEPLDRPLTGAIGTMFAASVHAVGWPAARGGSQAVTDALVSYLESLGGEVVTGHHVRSLDDLPPARAVLLDVMPRALAEMAGDRLPARYRRRLTRYRHGPGVFKVDYALSEPVPWVSEQCRRAGTVHLGGRLEEIAASEREVAEGRVPERPLTIVAQQSLFDPSRAPGGQHTLWAYAHVPAGSTADMSGIVEGQIERFAPGFRDTVLARAVRTPADLEAENPNYVGGDIAGGSFSGRQAVFRPLVAADPYSTPDPALYLCSSATPPGAGVHGMCGFHAARSALRRAFGRRA